MPATSRGRRRDRCSRGPLWHRATSPFRRSRSATLRRCDDSPAPTSSSTGRWTTRRPCAATCATSRGSTAGSAARALLAARAGAPARPARRCRHTLLDVGTGARRHPARAPRDGAPRGRPLRVTAVDRRPEVLDAARAARPALATDAAASSSRSPTADRSPWPDGSFDVVHASLLLHHLEPRDADRVPRGGGPGRAARASSSTTSSGRAATGSARGSCSPLMTRNRYTRHDGPLSVRARTRGSSCGRCSPAARPAADRPRSGRSLGHRVAIAAVPMPRRGRRACRRTRRGRGRRARRARRRRGRRRWAGGRRAAAAPRPRRARGRAARARDRPGAGGLRRVRVAGGRRASCGALGLDAATLAAGRPADPRDARGDAGAGPPFRADVRRRGPAASPAVGFDRSRARPRAARPRGRARAPTVRRGVAASGVELAEHAPDAARSSTARRRGHGRRSRRGRRRRRRTAVDRGSAAAGVDRPPRLADRVGLTWHVADEPRRPTAARRPDGRAARRRVLRARARCRAAGSTSASCSRVARWRERLAADGARRRRASDARGDPAARRRSRGVARRAGRPTPSRARARSAAASRAGRGPGWLLVGDAAGFLDPFTGEGLHRALVSARLAAEAIDALAPRRRRRRRWPPTTGRCARGSRPRTSSRCSSRRSSPGRALFEYAARRLARPRRRPCDDGPRDGRPRPGVPRPRPAVPRRAPRPVTARPPRRASARRRADPDRGLRAGARRRTPSCCAGSRPATSTPGAWTLPGGGLDFGEDPADGVLRELEEETGLTGAHRRARRASAPTVLEPDVDREAATGSTASASSTASTAVGGELRDELGRLDRPRRVDPVRAQLDALPVVDLVAWARDAGGPLSVRSTIGIDVAAPPELVFRLARDVTRWERLLPHYARSRSSGARPTARSCATSSRGGRSCPCSGSGSP